VQEAAAPAVPADGRAARALRTREAIVDACIALVEEGDLRPTAPRIAQRAGVSVRSVFQHFDDLPSLHIAVTESIAERMAALVGPIDAALPLDDRIARFVEQRSNLLEAMMPFGWRPASTVRSRPRYEGRCAPGRPSCARTSSRSSHRNWPASRRRSAPR
jgi:AcrR family transcriptional regulator